MLSVILAATPSIEAFLDRGSSPRMPEPKVVVTISSLRPSLRSSEISYVFARVAGTVFSYLGEDLLLIQIVKVYSVCTVLSVSGRVEKKLG